MKHNLSDFKKELEALINKHSLENGSDTPDFILAEFLRSCFESFNKAVLIRSRWYNNREVKQRKWMTFAYLLDHCIGDMSLREAEKEIGIPYATLARLRKGSQLPNAENLIKVCEYADVDPRNVILHMKPEE